MGGIDKQPGKTTLVSPEGPSKDAVYPAIGKQTQTAKIDPSVNVRIKAEHELSDATASVKSALEALYRARETGVRVAEAEAKAYSRQGPAHEESLLFELAMLGLEVATAGIAGMVAKRIEGPIKRALTVATSEHSAPAAGIAGAQRVVASIVPPSDPLIAGINDGLKQTIKSAGKSAGKGLQPRAQSSEGTDAEGGSRRSEISADPLLSFFAREENVLQTDQLMNSESISSQSRNQLEPMLDSPSTAERAVEALREIASAIRSSTVEATAQQAQASATHWLKYVSQTSNGSKADAKSGKTVTDTSSLTAAPSTDGPPVARRGLVDVEFAASAGRPEMPAKIKKLVLTGSSNTMAVRLAKQPLIEVGLAVRAHGVPSDGDALLPITVVRDEAGSVTYTDGTGAPGSPAKWFARKAGIIGGGEEAQLIGARKLIESEIMSQRIPEELIKTDSTDIIGQYGERKG